jgi:hypothetical protein
MPMNPAAAVRGPEHVVKTGKTPMLDAAEWPRRTRCARNARALLDLGSRWGCPAHTRPSALYLDFNADLHDLGGWNAKIRGWKIGIEVHRGEQGFAPDRHA